MTIRMVRSSLSPRTPACASDIGLRVDGAYQTLDGAIGKIDVGADQDEDADHQPDGEKTDDAETKPDPEGLNGVLEMAMPDRAGRVVALDVGENDAGNAGQSDAQERCEIKPINDDDERARVVDRRGHGRHRRYGRRRNITHRSLPVAHDV